MWFEHRSPANKHNCWNVLCYWDHVTRNKKIYKSVRCLMMCMQWNVALWVGIALAFHTKYLALYESEEIINCQLKLPSSRNIIKEGVLRIPQSSSITGTSPSDCLVSYPGHSSRGEGFLPLWREALSVFYSPSWQGNLAVEINSLICSIFILGNCYRNPFWEAINKCQLYNLILSTSLKFCQFCKSLYIRSIYINSLTGPPHPP